MNKSILIIAYLFMTGCSDQSPHSTKIISPTGDQAVTVFHQSCGAGCNAKDTIFMNFKRLDGQMVDEKIADIRGAANIEIAWLSPNKIIIGGCNASSANIKSDILSSNKSGDSSNIGIMFSRYKIEVPGKVICRGAR
ncbi:hypothetical protein [Sphingomonas beigongshangi]|uniref:hypothetical protein n=1 Tax=Sphingomonas beigongshangi TaxID=2782540 RepID=UPI00193AE05B|nr:hypothetical protein [Sphingomonas beigongshangi]